VAVVAGGSHSLGLKADGSLWTWGLNQIGQLGLGTTVGWNTPQLVVGYTDWVEVAAGSYHTLGMRAGGSLYSWGYNGFGQLGLGYIKDGELEPLSVSTGWATVATGGHHSLGRKIDGTLWAWGYNHDGQLGLGALFYPDDQYTPQKVGTERTGVKVGGGGGYSLGLQANGSLWAWGRNNQGELGLGNTSEEPVLSTTQVPGASNWVAVVAGGSHSLGLKADGSLWAWGLNASGQLGLGDTVDQNAPTRVRIPRPGPGMLLLLLEN
jgi:alpha-tubulin suppressor-like RCC1 family protein